MSKYGNLSVEQIREARANTETQAHANTNPCKYGKASKFGRSFNNKFYQQKDVVGMGSSIGPVLTNIVMTELEDVIIKPLVVDGTSKFYSRFVNGTLLIMKPENVSQVHKALNKFDNKLRFTVDMFQNEVPHFLDLELSLDGVTIFRKDTYTGLYVNFTGFVP